MDIIEDIAARATPHYRIPLRPALSPEHVKNAAASISNATTIGELKALAYALYCGALDVSDIASRLGEPDSVLKSVAAFLAKIPGIDEREVTKALSGKLSGYGGHVIANLQDEGWALALFDLMYDSRHARWLDLFRTADPAIVGIRWALQGHLQSDDAKAVVDVWCDLGDPVHVAAAGLVIEGSAIYAIEGFGSIFPIQGLPRVPRAMIAGRLASMLLRKQRGRESDERSARRASIIADLTKDLPTYIQNAKELRGFMGERENDPELIAFALKLPLNNKSMRQALDNAHKLLQTMFSKIRRRDEQQEEHMLHYVAGWMLNDLAHAAVQIDMQTAYFEELLGNLRFDEFTYDFENDLYYEDRARAIILCAIGAIVATVNQGVSHIGDVAREAARILSALPVGISTVLDAAVQEQLESNYGIKLPAA